MDVSRRMLVSHHDAHCHARFLDHLRHSTIKTYFDGFFNDSANRIFVMPGHVGFKAIVLRISGQ